MATKPILVISPPPAAAGSHQATPAVSRHVVVFDYWAAKKPRVNFLMAVATFTGFYLRHAAMQKFPAGVRS